MEYFAWNVLVSALPDRRSNVTGRKVPSCNSCSLIHGGGTAEALPKPRRPPTSPPFHRPSHAGETPPKRHGRPFRGPPKPALWLCTARWTRRRGAIAARERACQVPFPTSPATKLALCPAVFLRDIDIRHDIRNEKDVGNRTMIPKTSDNNGR
jgi:hypothetical protein